jgi:hypothetical protein
MQEPCRSVELIPDEPWRVQVVRSLKEKDCDEPEDCGAHAQRQ